VPNETGPPGHGSVHGVRAVELQVPAELLGDGTVFSVATKEPVTVAAGPNGSGTGASPSACPPGGDILHPLEVLRVREQELSIAGSAGILLHYSVSTKRCFIVV